MPYLFRELDIELVIISYGYMYQVQLVRIRFRVPGNVWTTQKVFHLMNFIVNGCKCYILFFVTLFILNGLVVLVC